jgi:GNAT superfamily N-acetyltransferase
MSRGRAIRQFRDDDAAVAAALIRDAAPEFLTTAELLVHEVRDTPARAHLRYLVAEEDERLVGFGQALLRWRSEDPGIGVVWVCVARDARLRGHGSALYDEAVAHVRSHGAHTLNTFAAPGDDNVGFAERRGFVPTRSERTSRIDPTEANLTELPELAAARAAEGFRLAPLRELLDRPHELYRMYDAAEQDMPTDYPRGLLPFEEWERETLHKPLLDLDGSMNVLHGERPVAFAWLLVDREGGRGEHELTGTHPDFRGRGLARLAKLAALRWAADNGIRTLLTGNDAANAPMLAINERLGYRPGPVWTELARGL